MTFAEKTKELKLSINHLPIRHQVELLNEYRFTYQLSERGVASRLGMSKSQVHRLISLKIIPEMVWDYLESGRGYNLEKYVLFDLSKMPESVIRKLAPKIVSGEIQKRAHLKEYAGRLLKAKK